MDQSVISIDQITKIKTMSKEIGKSMLETAFELNLVDEFEPTYKYLKSLNINSVLQPSFDRNKDEHIS